MTARQSASVASAARPSFAERVRHRAFANGVHVYVLENRLNPTLAISGSLRAGRLFAPADRRLIASVTAGELLKGTAKRTKLELAEALESRAASLSFSSDATDPVGVDVSGSALSRDTDLLLDILMEALVSPSFPEEELEKEKKRMVGSIRQQQDQTSTRAIEEAMRRVYPPEHPLHRLTGDERIARVEALRRDDLESYYAARWGAASLSLVVVGDVEADRILDRLEKGLGSWRPGPATPLPETGVPPPMPCRETVAMPDKASADVVLAMPADLKRTDDDFLACSLANSALGQSSLTSRLGVRVRDVEGLTYGIHSSLSATHIAGPFLVSLTVKPESRDAALASTLDEIRKFLATGLTDKEIAEEKSSRIGRFKVDLGSNAGMASALDAAIYYGFGIAYLDEFPARVAAVTKERADAAFARRVRPDRFTIVSAGSFG
ncbi:MAG TPA: pitrilysin family protein [Thermoanaerobaculia bacterium]|jgi:zinc protease